MSLDLGLTAASSGLASINQQMSVISQNVANAGTAGYAREVVSSENLTAGGVGYGARTGVATQETDAALQSALNQQNADVAGQQVTSDALASLDAAQGSTAAGNDLASQLGKTDRRVHHARYRPLEPGAASRRGVRRKHAGRRHPRPGRCL